MLEGGKAAARRWAGAFLFLGTLGLYLATRCRGAFPGESAAVTVQFGRGSDFPPFSHPLYAAAVWVVAHLPGGTLAGRLNLFSALCGALAVTLFFHVLLRVPLPFFADAPGEGARRRLPRLFPAHYLHIPLLAALFGALTLALSAPFWFVATRAHYAAFDTLLLAALAGLLLHYFQEGEAAEAVGFAFGLGMLTTESAPTLLLAPVAGGLFAWAMVRHGHLQLRALNWESGWAEWRLPLGCAAAFAAGMFPYLAEAAVLAHTPSAAWRGAVGWGPTLLEIARQQVRVLAACRAPPGGLLALAMNVVPILLLWATVRLAATGSRWAALLPAALAAGLAAAVAFNLATPWRVCGFLPLMVTPVAVAAAWTGHLFGMLPRLALALAGASGRSERLARGLAIGLMALGGGTLAFAGAAAFREVDGRATRLFDDYARRIADDCGGCGWLISASPFNDLVILAAAERKPPLRVVSLPLSGEPAYLRSVAARLEDPRFARLAAAGPDAFFREWLTREAAGTGTVAILDYPDAWRVAGCTPVPAGTVSRGRRQLAADELAAWYGAQSALWAAWAPRRAERERIGHPLVRGWAEAVFRSLARNANDSGVILESLGRPGEAGEAYAAARRLDPDSVSARFNEAVLARRGQQPYAGELTRSFREFVRAHPQALCLDAARRVTGYIADPGAIRAFGLSWAPAR